jgi:hypothetical protein
VPKVDLAERFETHLHWEYFLEFAEKEMALGGPDPQLETLGPMAKDLPRLDRVWAMGCFGAGYTVATAEVLWNIWPVADVIDRPEVFETWVSENWKGITLRRERRAVRTPGKFAKCLISYAHWAYDAADEHWWDYPDYVAAYESISRVWGMGRYINLKILELLFRHCGSQSPQDQLMARGGWSPRMGMASLYPDSKDYLLGDDSIRNVLMTEALACRLKEECAEQGVFMSWFQLQVFLCEYKQALRGKKYPGRSHDSELDYYRKSQAYWNNESGIYAARAKLFDHEVLGEASGMWSGVRETLERTLLDHGYLWSDLEFDYVGTTDFKEPKRW